MGVALRVDRAAWDAHLARLAGQVPGLVPVAKGNGYGFGLDVLAAEATRAGASMLAVGTADEVAVVRQHFAGDIVVLTPWRPGDPVANELVADPNGITTVSRLDDLAAVARLGERPRVIVEVLTSMKRHGVPHDQLSEVSGRLGAARFEGWTIHLPMVAKGRVAEAERLSNAALNAMSAPVWLSHVTLDEYASLQRTLGVTTHLRLGTSLWLSPSVPRTVTASVLDVHPVRRGEHIGYWQRAMPQSGFVVVVAGGTAHGVALEAPTAASTLRQRAIAAVNGSLESVGLARSPYSIGGHKRWFVEPPHMQSSLVFVPGSSCPVSVGDEVPLELRLTTANVDAVMFDGLAE